MPKPHSEISIAPFRFDVTPPLHHPLLAGLIAPVAGCDDPLEAIGYVLLGDGDPIVVCAVDWAGLMNEAHLAWRSVLAEAAGTTPDRVAVQCVHQHNAPFVCLEAAAVVARHPDLPPMFSPAFFQECLARARSTVREALRTPRRIAQVAHGLAQVENIASNRRVHRDAAGRVREMRFSACTNPELAALPEGTIDPMLQTIAFYGTDGEKVVACHYYATHPMSYYRDGRVSSDFCGLARKRRQADEPGCTHLYFTGCAGNVAAGKFNDGSPAARVALADRLYRAIVESERTLAPRAIEHLSWQVENVLPPPHPSPTAPELEASIAHPSLAPVDRLVRAFRLAWLRRVQRGVPLGLSRLRVNDVSILHLPGEMFVEYQLRARAMRPDRPVAVAAYGDDGLWYVPTREEYPAGGYEVSVAFSGPEVDEIMTEAIRHLLA